MELIISGEALLNGLSIVLNRLCMIHIDLNQNRYDDDEYEWTALNVTGDCILPLKTTTHS